LVFRGRKRSLKKRFGSIIGRKVNQGVALGVPKTHSKKGNTIKKGFEKGKRGKTMKRVLLH